MSTFDLIRALERGLITLPEPRTIPPEVAELLRAVARSDHKDHVDLPSAIWAVALQFWIVLYGAINAEVFGNYSSAPLQEGAGLFFDHTMRRALAVIGVDQAAIDAGVSPTY